MLFCDSCLRLMRLLVATARRHFLRHVLRLGNELAEFVAFDGLWHLSPEHLFHQGVTHLPYQLVVFQSIGDFLASLNLVQINTLHLLADLEGVLAYLKPRLFTHGSHLQEFFFPHLKDSRLLGMKCDCSQMLDASDDLIVPKHLPWSYHE